MQELGYRKFRAKEGGHYSPSRYSQESKAMPTDICPLCGGCGGPAGAVSHQLRQALRGEAEHHGEPQEELRDILHNHGRRRRQQFWGQK
jgi:hypothetical protein